MEVTAALEIPRLEIRPEKTNFNVYANDIAMNRDKTYTMGILVRNPTLSVVEGSIECPDPFNIPNIGDLQFKLTPGQSKNITVKCDISYEKILKWSGHAYKNSKSGEPAPTRSLKSDIQITEHLNFTQELDEDQKVMSFSKKLYFNYSEEFSDFVPLGLSIFYPKIMVKPNHVKFEFVLIGRTVKTMITIYNLTGSKVIFEMMKSVSSQEIVVSPSNGVIEPTTGVNCSCQNIFIYFTPLERRIYQESVRVATNIPRYYFDISIRGTGSINEKFSES